MIKSKKGATSISILLLVIMTLILVGAALISFVIYGKQQNKQIFDAKNIENIYVNERQINFFLKTVMEYSIKESYINNNFDLEQFKKVFFWKMENIPVKNEDLKNFADIINSNKDRLLFEYKDGKTSITLKNVQLKYSETKYENKWVFALYIIPVDVIQQPIETITVFYGTDIKAEVSV